MKWLALFVLSPALAMASQGFRLDGTISEGAAAVGGSSSIAMDDDTAIEFGNDTDCWFVYDSALTQFQLECTDVDGGGTDGVVWSVDDGTDDVDFTGSVIAATVTASDGSNTVSLSHDGTNALLDTSAGGVLFTDDIKLNAEGGNNPVIQFTGDSVTFNRQNASALSLVHAREISSLTKVTMVSGTSPVRWSGATQIDSGGADGRLRFRTADGTNGVCLDVGTSRLDYKANDCSSAVDFSVPETSKMCLDGASCTSYFADQGGYADFYVNGSEAFSFTPGGLYRGVASALEIRRNDNVGGAYLRLYRNDTSPTNGDTCSGFQLRARNSSGTNKDYGTIDTIQEEVTAGDEDASIKFSVLDDGSLTEFFRIDSSDDEEGVYFGQPAVLHVQTAAVPSAPVTCDADTKGMTQVVDDNNDGAGTEICYCGMTDDSTYDWLNIADNAACSFF